MLTEDQPGSGCARPLPTTHLCLNDRLAPAIVIHNHCFLLKLLLYHSVSIARFALHVLCLLCCAVLCRDY